MVYEGNVTIVPAEIDLQPTPEYTHGIISTTHQPENELTGKWHQVTFYDLEGGEIMRYTLQDGEVLVKPDYIPHRNGLDFQYWYDFSQSGAHVPYAFGQQVFHDVNLVPYYFLADMPETNDMVVYEDISGQLIQEILTAGEQEGTGGTAGQQGTVPDEMVEAVIQDILFHQAQNNEKTPANNTMPAAAADALIADILYSAEDDAGNGLSGGTDAISMGEAEQLISDILATDFHAADEQIGSAQVQPQDDVAMTDAHVEATITDIISGSVRIPTLQHDQTTENTVLDNVPQGLEMVETQNQADEAQDASPVNLVDAMLGIEAGGEIVFGDDVAEAANEPIPDLPEGEPAEGGAQEEAEVQGAAPWVEVHYSSDGEIVPGSLVTVTATVHNIDPALPLHYQWENNAGGSFQPVSFATGRTFSFIADESNAACEWRVNVTIE